MGKIVTFGEIMGRMAPDGCLRFAQALPGQLTVTFAGAEANVAASIAILGGESIFVSALPKHAIADACIATLKGLGVDTSYILRSDVGRLGLYFLETGANQRPGNVIYDREGSSIGMTAADSYPWKSIFKGADWFHISGITPAISSTAAQAALAAVKEARAGGLTVSCDLNFRKKLWRWDPAYSPNQLAEKTMRQILSFVDVVIGNEQDAMDVLGINAGDTDVNSGKLAIERYPEVAKKIVSQFNNVSKVAITLRESISASHNNWGAMLYEAGEQKVLYAPWCNGAYEPYQIKNIVDRVGAGDSFAAGLIFALTNPQLSQTPTALSFAVAASCLAHSVYGDFNYCKRSEVEALMKGSGSGRVVR